VSLFHVMNSRSSSFSAHSQRRTSVPERRLPRRRSTVSSIERGQHGPSTAPAVHSITEEIAEIKRYEDFTTIDWVQDDAREQLRRRARRKENAGFWERDGIMGWRRKLWESYDAGQAWLVVTLVGVVIGLNAAALNIITEWLSDVKLGYCTTAFYLNEQFCCWGAENGCDEWKRWTPFGFTNYVVYVIFSVSLLRSFFSQVAY
jgi:chloride channel 3/4/5